jgi:hypothetical protein
MTRAVRKRRTRDETRVLLLDAALRVVLARARGDLDGTTNPLAGVRITEALDEVNRVLIDADPDATPMTTGAVYNIWPTQEEFQEAILDRVFVDAAFPGIDEVRSVLQDLVEAGVDWRTIVADCFGLDFELSFHEPTMFVMIGVTALGPTGRVAEQSASADENYLVATADMLTIVLEYAGRRLRDGRSIADLVWAIEAVESGYLLRRRTMPDVPMRTDAAGRTSVQSAIVAVVEAFSVEIENES